MGGETIGGNDIESDSRKHDDLLPLGLGIQPTQRFKNRNFSGNVQIVGAGSEAGVGHWQGRVNKGPGTVKDHRDVSEDGVEAVSISEIGDSMRQSERPGQSGH
jgi:hypothetical protein